MAWFFTDECISGDTFEITGEDARHIERSLRMKSGERLTLVTPDSHEHICEICGFSGGCVSVSVLSDTVSVQEPDISVTLYQSLPKGDKMELIIQKAVELGVTRIVPVISARCVSRPDEKTLAKKCERWQKIALGAARQSCRAAIPKVMPAMSFSQAISDSKQSDCRIIFYELGGAGLRDIIAEPVCTASVFIGCEGGFDPGEVQEAVEAGCVAATLGKRILRAETAPLAAITAIMYQTGNLG